MNRTWNSRSRPKTFTLPWPWRLLIFLHAAMIAWIGFTHGSGFELYFFKFVEISYKFVFRWDHNLATLIALLAFLTMWRAYRPVLYGLSLIYLILTLMATRYGGFVDEPWPIVSMASSIVLPLAAASLKGDRIAYRLGQWGLFLSLCSFAILFLNAPPYYIDQIIVLAGERALTESVAQIVLLLIAALIFATFALSSRFWIQALILAVFTGWLAVTHWNTFGLAPESLLKLSPFALSLILGQASRSRKRSSYAI